MDENDAGPAGWFANMNRQASMFEASVIVSAAAAAASAAPAAAASVAPAAVSDTTTAACSVAVSDQTSDVAVDAPAASGGAGHSIGPLMLNQMEDEPAEDQELCSHQYTENSPHGKEKKRSRGTVAAYYIYIYIYIHTYIFIPRCMAARRGRAGFSPSAARLGSNSVPLACNLNLKSCSPVCNLNLKLFACLFVT